MRERERAVHGEARHGLYTYIHTYIHTKGRERAIDELDFLSFYRFLMQNKGKGASRAWSSSID